MTYDYRCIACGKTTEHFGVRYEDRLAPRPCACGSVAEYVFPTECVARVRVSQPFFDEGLGCDVHGERERKQIMRSMGLIEAGDPVGGSRNIETYAFANMAGRSAPQGVRFADVQRANDNPEVHDAANMRMASIRKDGSVVTQRFEDGPRGLFPTD